MADAGEADPPKYGDYEAQRHWMEVTLHTPLRTWYHDVPELCNPGTYWPIDYPPISAYQSYVTGAAVNVFEPEAVALCSSRGYESASSKRVMRWTVVLWDLLGALECPNVLGLAVCIQK